MKKTLLILISSLTNCLLAQTTIFADGYPNGLICEDFDKNEKVFYPIDNKTLKAVIHKSEVNYVLKGGDTIYKNPGFEKSDKVTLPIEPRTGKVFITKVIETSNTQKDMYNALKAVPNSKTKYEFISGNDVDKDLINYAGFFYVKFAGDLNTVQFTLLLKLKEGKVKYELTNFRMYFAEQKGNNIKGKTYTMDATHVHDNPLERFYIEAYRGDRFFRDINDQLNTTISEIETLINKPIKNDW